MKYNIDTTHFRDMYGHLLWVSPLENEFRLYRVGDTFVLDEKHFRVERVAVADSVQHVNLSAIEEDVNVTEGPHL